MYKEYKVEYRLYKRDGNEFQMRKIPLKDTTNEEVIASLIEMGYMRKNDKVEILNIYQSDIYDSDKNQIPNPLLNFIFNTKMGEVIFKGAFFIIGAIIIFSVITWIGNSGNNNSSSSSSSWGIYVTTPHQDAERLSNELDKKIKKADGNLQKVSEANEEFEKVLEEMTNLYFTEKGYQQTQEFTRLLKDKVFEMSN